MHKNKIKNLRYFENCWIVDKAKPKDEFTISYQEYYTCNMKTEIAAFQC